ncbi:MAG TPA: histidine kinase dimerization/phosphoacceptor domain -containing protein [Rectinemataceae bacterium]|nr:histidine kinase dimerization/phosphoacceptor domain -containing protein [Rectinemataceae bacterium]
MPALVSSGNSGLIVRPASRALHVAEAIGIILLSLSSISCVDRGEPKAAAGILDLRSWDFDRDGALPLAGTWAFYPERLIGEKEAEAAPASAYRRVPDLWKGKDAGESWGKGAGTYRLRVLLPPSAPELAIRYRTVSTAFELEVNDMLLAKAGKPSLDESAAIPTFQPGVSILPEGRQELDLVVRVSNHEYREGGLWRPFILGKATLLEDSKRAADIMVYVEATAILIMAINSAIIFFFRRQEKVYLYFTLFALDLFLRMWVTGEYLLVEIFPTVSFGLVVRLEYLSVFLPIPLFTLFLTELFPLERRQGLVVAIILPFAALFLLCLPPVPLSVLSWSVFAFYAIALVAAVLILAGIILPAIRRKREGAVPILCGGLILAAAMANDVLYTSFIITTGNMIGLGFVAFTMVQSGILGKRFSKAFDRSETLQRELASVNSRLAEENELYRDTQERLETALAEKDLLLREVHHRVKNSLQIVSSSLGLQAHRTSDPAVLEVYGMARHRIRAISLVHEKLYGLRSSEFLDIGEYARDLVGQLAGNFGGDANGVSEALQIDIETSPLMVDVDDCVDFGLILTELVVNAVKHSTSEGQPISIRLRLRSEGAMLRLGIEDGGPGFAQGFNPSSAKTLGFRILTGLVKKHRGSLVVMPGPGGRIELSLAILGKTNSGPSVTPFVVASEPSGPDKEKNLEN